MKKAIFGLIVGLVQLTGFSQPDASIIPVSDDLELIKISDKAYIHVSYVNHPDYGRTGANGLLIIDKDKGFLFDSPWTDAQTERLLSWLKDSMKVSITGFIPNHWHIDCMGGLGYIKEQQIRSYASQMTIDIARSNNLPVPDTGFTDSLQLTLGDMEIKCVYPGAAHSADNIAVWIPSEQILFAGCIIKSTGSGNLGNTADGDLRSYPKTIARLMELFPSVKVVIPGHGRHGGFELLTHTYELASH